MNIKKISAKIIAAVLVLLVLYAVFHHRKSATEQETSVAVKNIAIATIHKKDVNDFYEASGLVQAKTISVVSSRVMGTVTDVLVSQGDKVAAGQELMTIANSDLAQQVKAAQAAYDESLKAMETAKSNKILAETTYNRYKRLYDEKALSGQEMDQMTNQKDRAVLDFQRAESNVEAANAGLQQVKVNFDFSRITSPIDGVVTHKTIDKGSMAVPGTPLLTVEDTSGYKAEVNVDEHMAHQIQTSMPVDVAVDPISTIFKGTITEIVPSIDASSRTFVVKALMTKDPNEHLLTNGLYARVLIPQKRRSLLAVPASAIVQKGQLVGIYVIEKGHVSYRMIRTGKTYGSEIEVLAGLNDGERIVAAGVENIFDGEIISDSNY